MPCGAIAFGQPGTSSTRNRQRLRKGSGLSSAERSSSLRPTAVFEFIGPRVRVMRNRISKVGENVSEDLRSRRR
jgi:hypothetical protein